MVMRMVVRWLEHRCCIYLKGSLMRMVMRWLKRPCCIRLKDSHSGIVELHFDHNVGAYKLSVTASHTFYLQIGMVVYGSVRG